MSEATGAEHDVAARLAALERENEALRRRLADGPTTPAGPSGTSARNRARSAAAVVLIVVGALLAPVAVAATWTERTLTDTDRYVDTVGPLADDPTVRSARAGRLTEAVMSRIDVGALVDGVTAGLAERAPPRPSPRSRRR